MPSQITDHQVDHLLLLVGKNPLPNAVAGKLLVKSTGKITLIHSKDTAHIADKLRDWLLKNAFSGQPATGGERVFKCEVEEFNVGNIYKRLIGVSKDEKENAAINKVTDAQRIGLNYTGGTKAMAVHVYRALENWKIGKSVTVDCSYLDARKLRMVFDPPELCSGSDSTPIPVGLAVKLQAKDDLFDLHGWTLPPPRTTPLLPQVAQVLATFNKTYPALTRFNNRDTNDVKEWVNWKNEQFKNHRCRKPNQDWKDDSYLDNVCLDFSNQEVLTQFPRLANVIKHLQSALGLSPAATDFQLGSVARQVGCTATEFCQWLDGHWLESVVLQALQDCPLTDEQGNKVLHEILMNLKPHSEAINQTYFELDVIALRGYQLFAFSCGTDSIKKADIKRKLFEAYFRAKQLGGDEARVALVCLADNSKEIEDETQGLIEMGAMLQARQERKKVDRKERQIRVFGRPEMEKLSEHLTAWIKCQSGENQ